MNPRHSLQRRITFGALAYVALLSAVVLVHGWVVNESAEELVWSSLLETEMAYFAHHARDDGWQPRDSELLEFYRDTDAAPVPPELAGLAPGLHDEVMVNGRETIALVRVQDGRRLVLALDITEFEQMERDLGLKLLLSSLLIGMLLGITVTWGVARLMRPLRELASRIRGLRPDAAAQRIEVPANASTELVVIADALNAYLQRHDDFVTRERAFVDSASHELRTPIAVIAGATELALDAEIPMSARLQLRRIQRTVRGVEELIAMLLVLAKDPARLARSSDLIELEQLLPEIADDHRHLCKDKALELRVLPLPACEVVAPVAIVQAAVGNLLRNAIENSDSGEVTLRLQPDAVVVIEDPGQGMSPEQISAIYARQAHGQGQGQSGGGLGLELITRVCRHLGWQLRIEPREGVRGTRATLDMGVARPGAAARTD
ncbi:MAG: sensor histidine kinase [Lysobacter sp.]